MNKAAGIITNQNVSLWYNKKAYVAGRSHPNFDKIVETYRNGNHADLPNLFDLESSVSHAFKGTSVSIKNGLVYVGKDKTHGAITKRIIEFFFEHKDVQPLVNFLQLLWKNPEPRVRELLFGFLEKNNLALCSDGHFLSFRATNSDLTAISDSKFQYKIGKEASVSSKRPIVDPASACGLHAGLHIGTFAYVSSFGGAPDKRFLLCRVNPAHVLSIPNASYGYDKITTWKLTPVAEVPREDFKDFDSNSVNNLKNYKPEVIKQVNSYIRRDKNGRFLSSSAPQRDKNGRFVSA